MKKLLLPILCVLILFSCGDDGDTNSSVKLNFKAVYDGSPFLMFDELDYGDATIQITDSDFFISNIELTNDQNEKLSLDIIDFIDFTNTNLITDPDSKTRGIDLDLGSIPDGNYTKLKFGIGLDSIDNQNVPEDFSSDNVLSTTSHYWEPWSSYIFMKLQGNYDNVDEGIDGLGFVFHIGNNELYREVELPIDLIVNGGNNVINIELEHQTLFDDDGSLFHIPDSPANHQPILNGPMFMVVDNFKDAFTSN